ALPIRTPRSLTRCAGRSRDPTRRETRTSEPERREESARGRAVRAGGDIGRVAGSVPGRRNGEDDVTVGGCGSQERRAARVAVASSAVAVRVVLAHLQPLLRQGV